MSDLYDIFGEELVSTTEQMIKICFVLSSDIDVLSRERSFDGGDYTLEVNTQCRVYCNKCDEITDEEIIALRKFASNFEEVETVETTWGETNWYDKSGTIVSEKNVVISSWNLIKYQKDLYMLMIICHCRICRL